MQKPAANAKMLKPEFEIEFDKLLNNPWQYGKKGGYDAIKDEWFEKTRHVSYKNWQIVISNIIDKETEFPPFAKIKKEIDSLTKDRVIENKSYKHCKVCYNSGSVSMLLCFKYKNQDGVEIREIKERYFETPGLFTKLQREGKNRYYRYTYHCRCEKGEDLHNLRNKRGYQLSWDEFKELKTPVQQNP